MVENNPVEIQKEGSYVTGLIGALVGALIGAVAWCLVMQLGIIASLVGFVIGWLAEKGYNLLKGKQGKGKIAILIIAVIIGVIVGNFGYDAYDLYSAINSGKFVGYTVADIPAMIVQLLAESSEYRSYIMSSAGIGLLFAGLGVFSLLRKAGQEVADQKYMVLE